MSKTRFGKAFLATVLALQAQSALALDSEVDLICETHDDTATLQFDEVRGSILLRMDQYQAGPTLHQLAGDLPANVFYGRHLTFMSAMGGAVCSSDHVENHVGEIVCRGLIGWHGIKKEGVDVKIEFRGPGDIVASSTDSLVGKLDMKCRLEPVVANP